MSTKTVNAPTTTFPVVNLLPPEIGERRQLRKVKAGLGVGLIATAVAVAALFVAASNDVSSAQGELTATKAQGARLQSQTAKYSNVPAVIAKVDAAKLQRSQAMGQEVRWSYYLNDLSLRIPSRVWLTKINVTQNVDAADTPPAASAPTYPVAGIGQATFEGTAYAHNDVASWLQMLSGQEGFTQAYFTSSTEDDNTKAADGTRAVKFVSQVTITADALSRRFEQKAGS
jgi:Tfp pilus assembly protein PilN